jgi:hypothetical protein
MDETMKKPLTERRQIGPQLLGISDTDDVLDCCVDERLAERQHSTKTDQIQLRMQECVPRALDPLLRRQAPSVGCSVGISARSPLIPRVKITLRSEVSFAAPVYLDG